MVYPHPPPSDDADCNRSTSSHRPGEDQISPPEVQCGVPVDPDSNQVCRTPHSFHRYISGREKSPSGLCCSVSAAMRRSSGKRQSCYSGVSPTKGSLDKHNLSDGSDRCIYTTLTFPFLHLQKCPDLPAIGLGILCFTDTHPASVKRRVKKGGKTVAPLAQ